MSGACWQEGGVSLSKNKQAVKRCSEVGGEQTLHRPRPLQVTVCPRGRQNVSVCAHVFFECRFLMSECVPLLVFLRSQVCMCVCDVRWGEVRWGEVRGISSSSQTSFRDSDERRRKEILLVGPPEPSKNQMFKSTVCVESAYLITTSSFSFLPLRRKDNQISVENCNRVRNQDQQGSPSEVYKSIYTFLQHEDKSQQRINLIVYVFHADIVS